MSGTAYQIPLGFRPTPNIGPNLGAAIGDAQQIMALQTAQKQQEQQNALRGILGAPDAIDPATGQPKPDVLNKVMGVDPVFGLKLGENALISQQRQLQSQVLKTKAFEQQFEMTKDVSDAAYTAYKQAIDEGLPETAARARGQAVQTEGIERLKSSGNFSPQQQQNFPAQFDPIKAAAHVQTFEQWQAAKDKKKTEDIAERRAKVDEQREADAARDRGITTEKDTDGRAMTIRPAAPVGQQYTYSDGTAVPAEKLGDIRKVGTTPKGGGADHAAIESDIKTEHPDWTPGQIALEAKQREKLAAQPEGSTGANRAAIAAGVNADPAFKDKPADVRAQEVESRVAVASGKLTDPASRHDMASGIASYQLAPLSNYALTRPGGPETMAEVRRINPDYQETRYPEINKAMTAFGSGKQGDTIRSLNVATQHLETIDAAAEALKNHDIRLFNSIGNRIAEETGNPAPTTFDALKQIVSTEIEKAVAGGIGAVTDRDRLNKSLDSANSPAQLMAVSEGFKKLMAGQAMGLKNQYEDATGFKTGPFAFDTKLLPATQKALGVIKGEGARGNGASIPGSIATPDQLKTLPHAMTPAEIMKLPPGPFIGPGNLIGVVPEHGHGEAPATPAPTSATPATKGTVAAPPPLPETEAELEDGGIYASDKGLVRFDKAKKRFFPVGGR